MMNTLLETMERQCPGCVCCALQNVCDDAGAAVVFCSEIIEVVH